MHWHGEASISDEGFVHQALIYGSDQEFLDVALPFVEEGLRSQQPTLVSVQDRHIENLQEALGGAHEGLTLRPVEEWYETSTRTREKFAQWAVERIEHADRVRLIGEPPWALGHEARIRDWARHESVINVAFAGLPVTFACPYDANSLPDEVLKHARDTHPEIVDAAGSSPSRSYANPREFCKRLDATVEVQTREPSLEMPFGLGDLPAIRGLVGSFGIDAGLPGSRTEEIVLAVNEVVTNAVIHGRPPSTLRTWHTDDELIVEVTDAGEGIRNALVGQLPPPVDGIGGRGLWLARLLCDAVEVRDAGGCTVTMHVAAPSSAAVTAA